MYARRSQRLVAFDINNSQVKCAVMRRDGADLTLQHFHVEHVHQDEFEGTPGIDAEQREAVAEIVKAYGLAGEEVVGNLPYECYNTRLLVLPQLPAKEVRSAIENELRRNAFETDETLAKEFVTVDSFELEGVVYDNHLVVSYDHKRLMDTAAVFSEVGLKVVGFSVVPLSLANLLAQREQSEDDEVFAVVNVSHEETSFSFVRNRRLLFTREIPRASQELADSISTIVLPGGETFNLTRERTRAIVYEYGVISDVEEGDETDEGIPLDAIAVMMRPVLEKMLVEIRRSIDFCQEQFGVDPPRRIFLSGEGARMENFRDYLSTRLRLDVEFIDPSTGYQLDEGLSRQALRLQGLSLATTIGSALNVAGQTLIRPEQLVNHELPWVQPAVRASGAGVALLSAMLVTFPLLTAKRAHQDVQDKQQALARLEQTRSQYRLQADEARERKFRHDALLSLIGPEFPWSGFLADLSTRVGTEVELTKMDVRTVVHEDLDWTEDRVAFTGKIALEMGRLEDITSDLLAAMNASPYVEDVRLDDVRAIDKRFAEVGFNCRLVF